MSRIIWFSLVFLAISGYSVADEQDETSHKSFELVDINNDGFVSFSEITSADPSATAASLMRYDPNFDQRLNRAQYESYLSAPPLEAGRRPPQQQVQQARQVQRTQQIQRPVPSSRGYGS